MAVEEFLLVLAGGVLAGGSGYLTERSRARREETAQEQASQRDALRAGRLIAQELEAGRQLVAKAVEHSWFTWEPPHRLLSAAVWTEYRADFALHADDVAWRDVASAFSELDRLNWSAINDLELSDMIGEHRDRWEARTLADDTDAAGALAKIEHALGVLRDLEVAVG